MGAASDVARRWFVAPRGFAAVWGGLLAGPFAWALDLVLSYSLVQWTCGGGPPVVLHLVTLLALAIIAAGGYAAWGALQVAPADAPIDGAEPDQRGRFMAILGLLMCAFFAMVVIAGAIPRWVLDACQQ